MDITIVETNAVLILNFNSGNGAIRRIRSGGGSLANQDSAPGLRPCCFLRTPGLNSCRPKNNPLGGVDLSYEFNNQKRIRPLTSPPAPGIPQLPFPTTPTLRRSDTPNLPISQSALARNLPLKPGRLNHDTFANSPTAMRFASTITGILH
jgi:hypothetical protein